MFAED